MSFQKSTCTFHEYLQVNVQFYVYLQVNPLPSKNDLLDVPGNLFQHDLVFHRGTVRSMWQNCTGLTGACEQYIRFASLTAAQRGSEEKTKILPCADGGDSVGYAVAKGMKMTVAAANQLANFCCPEKRL